MVAFANPSDDPVGGYLDYCRTEFCVESFYLRTLLGT